MTVGIAEKFTKQSWEAKPWVYSMEREFAERTDTPASVELVVSEGLTATASISGMDLLLTVEGGVNGGVYDITAQVTTSTGKREEFDFAVKIKDTPSQYNETAQAPPAQSSAAQAKASELAAAQSESNANNSAIAAAASAALAQQVLSSAVLRVTSTDGVQAAIDALYLLGGGTVRLGVGVFSPFALKDGVIVDGEGRRASIVKAPNGWADHVVKAGVVAADGSVEFDAWADGVKRATPVGCRSGGVRNLTIDGNKANRSEVKHGLAYYGVDLVLHNVEIMNNTGLGMHVESPGGTFSITVGRNLQMSIAHIEVHDNNLGNIYYNGQSDSNGLDVLCYQAGKGAGQFNIKFGSKSTGVRWVGVHCWGDSDYAWINEGSTSGLYDAHMESASVAKVWARIGGTYFRGRIYEADAKGTPDTLAPAIMLDDGITSCDFEARISNIRYAVKFIGADAGEHRFDLAQYSADADAATFDPSGATAWAGSTRRSIVGTTAENGDEFSHPGQWTARKLRVTALRRDGWAPATVVDGVLTATSNRVYLNEASPVTVNSIVYADGGSGIGAVVIRNSGTATVTFAHATNGLRNNSGANIALAPNRSIGYEQVSGAISQQVTGVTLTGVSQLTNDANYVASGGAASFTTLATSGKHTASGGIDLASGGLDRAQYLAGSGWSSRSVSAGAISVGSSFIVLNEAASVTVTDLTQAAGTGIPVVMIRNGGTSAITFAHNSNKLRINSKADVVLQQHQSITFVYVSGTVWQQGGIF